jgi:5'-methylthioadenosine phosphorylase
MEANMSGRKVGVIGGSGLYEMEDLKDVKKVKVDTPFGEPSDEFITGRIENTEMVFLPRHGIGHRFLHSEVNYRANIYGMKKLGVEWIVSVSAVGSMKEDIAPGHLVIPDQFYDHTKLRTSTFFGKGIVAHVSPADPVCPNLAQELYKTANELKYTAHKGGTYICIEGPLFSTRAESKIYRQWGVDIIGMTNSSEVKLAREAEICFATLALATDYDCWHESEEDVNAEKVVEVVNKNVKAAKNVIRTLASRIPERTCACKDALKYAIVTNPEKIPQKTKRDLEPIIGKYIK